MQIIKEYHGRIPACGCFCGGCPVYTREKNACPGCSNTDRCNKCKSYHLCCKEKGLTHCYQCTDYPCTRLKGFSKRWLKHGQDFLANQQLLKDVGVDKFLEYWNSKV